MSEQENYYDDPDFYDDGDFADAPRSRSTKSLFLIAILAIAGLLIQNTLAANVTLTSGGKVEFGQGIQLLTSCSGATAITLTPGSTFVNASGAGAHKFNTLTVSNIPTSCYGSAFTFSAYDSVTATPLPLYGSSSTTFTIHDWNGNFYSPPAQSGLSVVTNSNSSFTVSFVTPISLASVVFRLTIQSATSNLTLTCIIVGSGCTFTSRDSSSNWTALGGSDDGRILYGGQDGAQIKRSTDYGATWTTLSNTGYDHWYSIATNSDGTKVYAAPLLSAYIQTSTDSGATWTAQTGSGARSWNQIAVSADGTKIAGATNSGYIYISTDSGVTWTAQTSAGSRNWTGISMSRDGSKLVALVGGGGANSVWNSTNGGTTWTQQAAPAGNPNWRILASSTTGSKVLATSYSGGLWYTTDYGVTWTQAAGVGSHNWYGAAVSGDGSILAASVGANENGQIFISSDGGTTWGVLAGSPTFDWRALFMPTDGSRLFAAGMSANIYSIS